MVPVQELDPQEAKRIESYTRGNSEMIAILGIAQKIISERQAMQNELSDINIESFKPIITPLEIATKFPMSENSKHVVKASRQEIQATIERPARSRKLIAVVGPCSVHDPEAAIEYAGKLKEWRDTYGSHLEIVMRAYFEKPRTTIGWEGFIEDPDLDGTYDKNKGLVESRKLVNTITNSGVPLATELLNTATPQYLDDGISLGAIGARTVESPLHRKLASGVSFPVGFKNGTGGGVGIAVDAITAASHGHYMDGVDMLGNASRFKTKGNPHGFLILRGGKYGPNFDSEHIAGAKDTMRDAGFTPAILVDCSHKNKVDGEQSNAVRSVAKQVAKGDGEIIGVALESNLVAGTQKVVEGKPLVYGQSITDSCIGLAETETLLAELYIAAQARAAVQ